MGNSTISLGAMFDLVTARGIFDPRKGPSGYGDKLALSLGNDVMADLITERFNWKWNSQIATPFYTNSWQQDYPQPAQPGGPIGWGEDLSAVDINNTQIPKPLAMPTPKWRRALPRLNAYGCWGGGYLGCFNNLCWMYNKDLFIAEWPGADVTFYPLIGNGPSQQNPIMNMLDANGNILIVTTFGTTGSTAPVLAANSPEGTTVADGSVVWTCVSPNSQGFRIDNLPSATGVVWQVIPVYQLDPPQFANIQAMINPLPNSYSRYFRRGLEYGCLECDPDKPGIVKREGQTREEWLAALLKAMRQGDREPNVYGLVPAAGVVEGRGRGGSLITADNPWGTL
jgi:hypothetical protein